MQKSGWYDPHHLLPELDISLESLCCKPAGSVDICFIRILNWNLPQSEWTDGQYYPKYPGFHGENSGCCSFNHCWPLGTRAPRRSSQKKQWKIPTREEHEMMLHWESQWQAQDPLVTGKGVIVHHWKASINQMAWCIPLKLELGRYTFKNWCNLPSMELTSAHQPGSHPKRKLVFQSIHFQVLQVC